VHIGGPGHQGTSIEGYVGVELKQVILGRRHDLVARIVVSFFGPQGKPEVTVDAMGDQ
jgi:hypothetical protein